MTNIIPKPLSYDYTLTVRTAQLLDVLVNLFKDGSKKERTKVNSWLNANTRDGFYLSINDNFFLTNAGGLMLPSTNTLSDTILSGRVEFDFLLLKPLLRIELDGQHHLNPQQRQLDISCDRTLLALGIPTIRFNATDVLNHPDLVLQEVLCYT